MIIIQHRVQLPYGWRLGTIIQDGDILTAWLLYGDVTDVTRSAPIEELLYGRSVPELTALALHKIEIATGVSRT
jgi:hypothetical protein